MYVLKLLMLIIEVICSLLLVVVILLQKSKSQGLGMAFGAGMGESLFGSRAGNVLSKITIVLGIVFLVNTLFLGIIFAHSLGTQQKSRGLMSAPAPVQRATPLSPPPGQPPAASQLPAIPSAIPPAAVPASPAAATPAPAATATPAPAAPASTSTPAPAPTSAPATTPAK